MKLYYKTRSKGRSGCSSSAWRVTEDYDTKAQLKKAKRGTYTSVVECLTEEQLVEQYATAYEKIMKEAKPY